MKLFMITRKVFILYITLFLSVLGISLWFFYPPFKNRLLIEYFLFKAPYIPRKSLLPSKNYTFTNLNHYLSNGKNIISTGVKTSIYYPDGKQEDTYQGTVEKLDVQTNTILIKRFGEGMIFNLAPSVIVIKNMWQINKTKVIGTVGLTNIIPLNEIEKGDFIILTIDNNKVIKIVIINAVNL